MARIILFNKPYGVLCQFSAPAPATREGKTPPTLKDYVPRHNVYPAGRLDADSEGLVVLTDDGGLQHRITDPHHKLPKTYYAEVEGVPYAAALQRLRRGVDLREFRTRPAQAEIVNAPDWLWPRVPPVRFRRQIPTVWLELVMTEGKNRQVRRMTAAVGLPTLRLIRFRVGHWTLQELAPGAWREEIVPAGNLPQSPK